MTPYRIDGSSLPHGLNELAVLATAEGFGMVDRLIGDYNDGSNAFSKTGEGLWLVSELDQVVAVGGLNIDPYYDLPTLGRIRHLYVHPGFRRSGIGARLIGVVESSGAAYFESFQLFTTNPVAAQFYEALGYSPVADRWKVSHEKRVAA